MLPKVMREHPVLAAVGSFAVFAAVTFPVWLAQIWPLFSDRPFTVVVEERGWGWALIAPLYGWFCLGVGVLLALLVGVALFDARRRRPGSAASSEDGASKFRITVFTHDESAKSNSILPISVRDLFRAGGWQVTIGQTDLPRHAVGIWVHGGTPQERSAAMWALTAMGQRPQLDDHEDGSGLEVIVGAVPPVQSPETARVKQVVWETAAERKAANEAARPQATKAIPEGEFAVTEKRDKQGHLYLRVENLKAEPKAGYAVYITELMIWSQRLNGGSGGFAPWPAFGDLKRPITTIEFGGTKGRIDHVEPKRFELVRNPGAGPWVIRGADGNQLTITAGVWRFGVELHWADGIELVTVHASLTTAGSTKSAEFVAQRIVE